MNYKQHLEQRNDELVFFFLAFHNCGRDVSAIHLYVEWLRERGSDIVAKVYEDGLQRTLKDIENEFRHHI